LADWFEAVKEASASLRVPLERRQTEAIQKLQADLEHRTPAAGAGR
jgi:hypothetical protein